MIVAEQDDELVGVCTLTFQPSIRTLGNYATIQEMYVAPMVRSAKTIAADSGCPMVELSTPPNGERAEIFYRNVGFTQVVVRMRREFE